MVNNNNLCINFAKWWLTIEPQATCCCCFFPPLIKFNIINVHLLLCLFPWHQYFLVPTQCNMVVVWTNADLNHFAWRSQPPIFYAWNICKSVCGTMSVHYKFKSSLDFDTISFDGLHISVSDLKKEIINKKKLGKTQDFDLQITNAQTKEGS